MEVRFNNSNKIIFLRKVNKILGLFVFLVLLFVQMFHYEILSRLSQYLFNNVKEIYKLTPVFLLIKIILFLLLINLITGKSDIDILISKKPFLVRYRPYLYICPAVIFNFCLALTQYFYMLKDSENMEIYKVFQVRSNIYNYRDPINFISILLLEVLILSILEEIFYRGFLLNYLNKKLSVRTSVVISSLLYGLSEGFYHFPQMFILGIVLSTIYILSDSLIYSMIGLIIKKMVLFIAYVIIQTPSLSKLFEVNMFRNPEKLLLFIDIGIFLICTVGIVGLGGIFILYEKAPYFENNSYQMPIYRYYEYNLYKKGEIKPTTNDSNINFKKLSFYIRSTLKKLIFTS